MFFLVGEEVICGCTGPELMNGNFQILNNIILSHGVPCGSVDSNDDIACVPTRNIGALLCIGDDEVIGSGTIGSAYTENHGGFTIELINFLII